ncbi:hypothetical protein [Lactobacillus amylovorus]|nr:hypothetical protein [Lactobacillus amylovorus]
MASIKKRGKTWYVRFSKRETQWDPEKQKMFLSSSKNQGRFQDQS